MVTLKTTPTPPQAPQADKTKNIFAKPIAGGKIVAEQQSKEIHSRNRKKGYAYLIVATVFLIAYSVSFLYPQLNLYLKAPDKIAEIESKIENFDDVILPNLEKEEGIHKAAYDTEFKEVEDALDKVFPEDTDKLGIVKILENFATSIDTKTPPFEFNSISFGEPLEEDGYTILPISTSIHSSRTNFDRFVQLVNLSGNLESDIPIRLMEISNINIRYRGVDPKTGEDKGVDFSVKLNAYSR